MATVSEVSNSTTVMCRILGLGNFSALSSRWFGTSISSGSQALLGIKQERSELTVLAYDLALLKIQTF